MGLTPAERKKKVAKLREEHEDYFQTEGKINALYILQSNLLNMLLVKIKELPVCTSPKESLYVNRRR